MSSALTKEEIMQWRRSTEKITLEEYAQRLGKSLENRKETNDLHDLFLKKKDIEEEIEQIKEIKKSDEPEKEQTQEKAQDEETRQVPDFEIKINFKKKLNKREELVFNYFCKKRKQKVSVKDLASMLELPNDYVYKYIKNLRNKLCGDVLVNAEQGGYILNV